MFVNTGQSRHIELIKEWLGSKPGFKTYLPIDKAEDLVFRNVAKYIVENNEDVVENKTFENDEKSKKNVVKPRKTK